MMTKKLNRTPPRRGFFMEKKNVRTLVIGAHYDDTAWCWAGLVALLAKRGQVDEAVFTDSNFDGIGLIRKEEQYKMMGILGMGILHAVGEEKEFKDGHLNKVNIKIISQAIIGLLRAAEEEGSPYTKIISFGDDGHTGHSDHKQLAKAVKKAFKSKKNHSVKELWQVGMSQEERKLWGKYFVPIPKNKLKGYKAFYVGKVFDDKIKAIKAHKTQYNIPVGGGRDHIKRLKQLPKVEWFKVYRRV